MGIYPKDPFKGINEDLLRVYSKYESVLLTDIGIAFGDMLHIYSSVGRWKYSNPNAKIYYLGGLRLGHEELHCNGFFGYSPTFYSDLFSGALTINCSYKSDSLDEVGRVTEFDEEDMCIARNIADYIESNNIEAFIYYHFPYENLVADILEERGSKCVMLNAVYVYYWGATGSDSFLGLNKYSPTFGIKKFVEELPKPLVVFHCRQRPWTTVRNPVLENIYGGCVKFRDKNGGSIVRAGVIDKFYKHLPSSDNYFEFGELSPNFDEQCYLIANADLVIDVHSVVLVLASELGRPVLHIDRVTADCPNVIEDRYFSIDKSSYEDKSDIDNIYDGILSVREVLSGTCRAF